MASVDPNSRARVREHRARLRKQGLRPIQIWVPDVRAPGFAEEAHRQARVVATSQAAGDDQAFTDAISEGPEQERAPMSGRSPAGPTTPASRVPPRSSKTTASTPIR